MNFQKDLGGGLTVFTELRLRGNASIRLDIIEGDPLH